MHYNLSDNNSVISQYLFELRDLNIQKDRMRFRRNLERVGEIIAYEISKHLKYKIQTAGTSLGKSDCNVLSEQPVLATILRAGLPIHQGLLNYFDSADNSFISAYRKHAADGSFHIELEYCSCPSLDNKVLIITDPMLATGSSMYKTLEELSQFGKPAEIHVVSAIASTEGVRKILSYPQKLTVWTGAYDSELDANSYIVPGLGDAGDLAFGSKLQN